MSTESGTWALLGLVLAGCGAATALPTGVLDDRAAQPDADLGSDGAAFCIDIDPTSADRACKEDEDCTPTVTGRLCALPCCGFSDAVNVEAGARFNASASSLPAPPVGSCGPCEGPISASCAQGQCTTLPP